jgi:copper resistance protein D
MDAEDAEVKKKGIAQNNKYSLCFFTFASSASSARGSLSVSIPGNPMNWLDWILTGARFVSLASAILLAAIFGFCLLIGRTTRSEFFPKRLTLILELAACLGQVAWVCALFWSMDPDAGSGGFEEFNAFFFGTQVGKIGLLRCCLLVLLAGYSAFRIYRSTRRMSRPPSLASWIESVLVLIQLVLLSWLSHAAAVVGPFGWLQLGNDILHLSSVAIWPGGLVPLWLLLEQTAPAPVKRDALLRFSNVAVIVAPLVGATGVLSGYFRVHSILPLITTPYGRYVTLKAACFFVLIGLGAANRLRLMPEIVGAPAEVATSAGSWRKLHRNILIEQLIFVIVMLAVARLVQLPPPEG